MLSRAVRVPTVIDQSFSRVSRSMSSTVQKVVIIEGVAGGATAAARIRRLSEAAEITILERGTDVSFANCGLPYYVGNGKRKVNSDRESNFIYY